MSSETCQVEKTDAAPVATILLHWESLVVELQALIPAALKLWGSTWSFCSSRARPPPFAGHSGGAEGSSGHALALGVTAALGSRGC